MRKKFIGILGILFLLACQTLITKEPFPTSTSAPLATLELASATQTSTPTQTSTASPIPTPTWVHQGPDSTIIPILLYHHIETSEHNSQFYVSPEKFDEQMNLLHHWGYTTITIDLMLKAIHEGADLPPRPILITFDDGHLSVFNSAFPIMQKYGFTGIVYIVGTYMGADGFMSAEQIKKMAQSGWKVGSHSMRHKDLTHLDYEDQVYEIFESRKRLSEKIDVPVNSFAYPFGFSNDDIFTLVNSAGYTSAMGLGYTHDQGSWNILLLQRRDVQGNYDLKKFASFLPWQGDLVYLPTDTPTPIPTPTRTPRP